MGALTRSFSTFRDLSMGIRWGCPRPPRRWWCGNDQLRKRGKLNNPKYGFRVILSLVLLFIFSLHRLGAGVRSFTQPPRRPAIQALEETGGGVRQVGLKTVSCLGFILVCSMSPFLEGSGTRDC